MRRLGWVLLLAMTMTVAGLRATSAQNAATPKFDVVSVKPCAPGDGAGRAQPGQRGGGGAGGGMRATPGRLNVNCMTVIEMINQSVFLFGAESLLNDATGPLDSSRRVRGGPAWIKADLYTINAESGDPTATGPTEGPILTPTARVLKGPMLRLLLE